MTRTLSGKTALVTGAGRGLGRAIALDLAREGVDLLLVARTVSELEETAAAVRKVSSELLVEIISADLAQQSEVERVLETVRQDRSPDILINNAGTVEPIEARGKVDPELYRRAFELNYFSARTLTFGLLPAMQSKGWGRIVNITTGAVSDPTYMVGCDAYVTSKSALEAHSINLGTTIGGTGVSVNAYRPGAVDTAMQALIREQDRDRMGALLQDKFIRQFSEGKLSSPEQAAAALPALLKGDQTGQVWTAMSSG